ncbi:MAG: hypothetical protein KGD61_10140 [Candidatus Lokiarchaeota archaeon]|nr:hypothetical protein [Candidatus Lokiarchaeota archaeon]
MSDPMTRSKIGAKFDKFFHKIFNPSHIAYTILFFIEVLILILFFFLGSTNLGDIGLFLATTFSLSFIILMFLGAYSKFDRYLFSKSLDQQKTLIFAGSLGFSVIVILIYFFFGSSTQIPIEFLGWDYILPGFYILIYFGWNMAQVFFLKTSFENISDSVNSKILPNRELNKNKIISVVFLILALSLAILTQLGTYFAFIPFFEPQSPDYSLEPLWWFNGWNVAMYVVILLISYRLIFLYIKSMKNDSYNIFSSVFFILIWLIVWYRSFSFINSFRSVTEAEALGIDAFRAVIDVLLMIFTAILVIRGLGSKTFKFRIFNPNNLAFFLFAFTLIYIEGQIIMITGAGSISGTYTNRSQVNLTNNFIVLLITIVFYWVYSEYILEKKGLIVKKLFKQEEVIQVVSEFKNYLINSGALDSNKVTDWEFKNYLKTKKLMNDEIEDMEEPDNLEDINEEEEHLEDLEGL